jgi:Tfp pilus assembly protein PilV
MKRAVIQGLRRACVRTSVRALSSVKSQVKNGRREYCKNKIHACPCDSSATTPRRRGAGSASSACAKVGLTAQG